MQHELGIYANLIPYQFIFILCQIENKRIMVDTREGGDEGRGGNPRNNF